MKEKTILITFSCIMTEALVTYATDIVNNDFSWKMILSILFGIIISWLYELDIPSYFDMKSRLPFSGNIITGIIISRGSNYVFDLLNNLK